MEVEKKIDDDDHNREDELYMKCMIVQEKGKGIN